MPLLKIGDCVRWKNCPPSVPWLGSNQIKAIEGARARLRFIYHPVPLEQLELADPTEEEQRFWAMYSLPKPENDEDDLDDEDW